MKLLLLAVTAVSVLTSLANADGVRTRMTPEQRARLPEVRRRQSGGYLHIEGKGFLSVVNAQKTIPASEIEANVRLLREITREVAIKVDEADFSIQTAGQQRIDSGAGAVVYVIDDPTLPISLIAMEEGWGCVNVAGLRSGDSGSMRINLRLRKEFIRVSSVVFTGPKSQFKTSPLQTVRSLGDLDKVIGEDYGMDAMSGIMNNLSDMGITPGRTISYRSACQQGVAPQPTNDLQKAIWNEFHEVPINGIEIKFDPKKGI